MSKEADSIEIMQLRHSFHYGHQDELATPARLGAYAAEKQRSITDFGAHSARWIGLFRKAWTARHASQR